jgi:hypothetical protein
MTLLYSPPNNGIPQELPERWRYPDGRVYNNLKSFSNQELQLLDWVGPYTYPVAKQYNENGNVINNNYDYDPETHKVAWYKHFRKYIILEKNVDEIPYQDGQLISPVAAPDWKKFQSVAVAMIDLNQYIAQILPIAPLIAIAIPTAIRDMVAGSYTEFANIWNNIEKLVVPPQSLISNIEALAKECNLPEEFVKIFKLND